MKLSDIKPNPDNPRIIKDESFEKLCNSIKEFPKMMKLRPIVVDMQNMVLGGNMRLKALQHLGFKEIPDEWVKRADELTEDEKRRFIIADNVSGGEWDWDTLKADWGVEQLNEWGLDVPDWGSGSEFNTMSENDIDLTDEFDPIGVSKGLQRVVFIFDGSEEAESYLKSISIKDFSKKGQAWQVNMSSQYI